MKLQRFVHEDRLWWLVFADDKPSTKAVGAVFSHEGQWRADDWTLHQSRRAAARHTLKVRS